MIFKSYIQKLVRAELAKLQLEMIEDTETAIETATEDLKSRIKDLETECSELKDERRDLERSLNKLDNKFEDLEYSVEEHEEKLDNLDGEYVNEGAFEEVKESLENLEGIVTEIRKKMATTPVETLAESEAPCSHQG